MRRKFVFLAISALLSMPLQAQNRSVESRVYVEDRAAGTRTIAEADALRRGDRVVTVLDWNTPRRSTTVTSRIPAHLSFLDSSADSLEVSIDGGRSWMTIENSNGGRVTHLRWRAAPGRGRLAYSAIVR